MARRVPCATLSEEVRNLPYQLCLVRLFSLLPASVLQGEHTEALGKYAMALSYINDDFMVQLHGPHAAKAGAVKQPVHLNMAACQLKLKDWQGAAWNCSQVGCVLL